MTIIEKGLFWIALFMYVASFGLGIFGFIGRRDRLLLWGHRLLLAGFAFHSATALTRWVSAGHSPVTDTYELNLTGTWFLLLLFIVFERIGRADRVVGLVVAPLAFLIMGYGYLTGVEIKPMGPAFQSPWLFVHVVFAWLAFGSYAIATGMAIFLLLKRKFPENPSFKQMRSLEELDDSSQRFIALGFVNHAVMLVSGAIWAKMLWGHYWGWDPLETWSLIAFLVYALYLHSRTFLGWKMDRAAWLAVAALLVLAVSFWGVGFLGPTLHPGP